MTSVTEFAGRTPLVERLSQVLTDIRKADSVTYVTLVLAVVFGFPSWYYQFSAQLALLIVLLVPSTAKRPALWGFLAIVASIGVVLERDLADNHKYLLCYWLWVMCIAHIPDGSEFRDQIIRFNARFFLVFIFLGAVLQKFLSSSYMSGAMFELELLLDPRFHAFGKLVGIDANLAAESLRRALMLRTLVHSGAQRQGPADVGRSCAFRRQSHHALRFLRAARHWRPLAVPPRNHRRDRQSCLSCFSFLRPICRRQFLASDLRWRSSALLW